MRTRCVLLTVILAGFLLSGCLQQASNEGDAPQDTTTDESGTWAFEWPPIEDALIRPGVQIQMEGGAPDGNGGFCTTNFVFTDDAGEVYIGTAAHCAATATGLSVRLQSDPDFLTRTPGPIIGTVHYSAYWYENITAEPCFVVHYCPQGDGNHDNDFALIRINEEYRDKVHPAVLHFGGPTGLAPLDEIAAGDTVWTYGNSPLRPGPSPLDAREGTITAIHSPWSIDACVMTAGVSGDSGSNVLLDDGRALGVLVTMEPAPGCGVQNGITVLETALAYAEEQGYPVQLATWDRLQEGLLV
jgi:hypothetical protein